MTIIMLLVIMVICTVTGNVLLKTGATKAALVRAAAPEYHWSQEITALFNLQIITGTLAFAAGLLFYLYCLQRLPLNVVQSFAAAQFVATILAAVFVLSEQIGQLQWAGIFLISGGIFLVGWGQA